MKSPRVGIRRAEFVLSLGLAMAVVACAKGGSGAAAPDNDHALVGSSAPEFEVPAQGGGQPLSLASHRGKVVVVDFWATWCEPCKESFPFYQTLAQKYPTELVVLAVSVDDEPAGIVDFIKQTGVTFAVGWDEGQSVAHLYNPAKMPTSYMVDKNGVVQFVHAGFTSDSREQITLHIEQLLE